MVMKPKPPGGAALDALDVEGARVQSSAKHRRRLLSQALSSGSGRSGAVDLPPVRSYEGIDHRVLKSHTTSRTEVLEVSIGDYVPSTGGEVAALAITEGGRPPDPGIDGQPGITRGGLPRGRETAQVSASLHQARLLARARRTSCAPVGGPWCDRRVAA